MKRVACSSLLLVILGLPAAVQAARSLQIVSPLQTLTLWDNNTPPPSPRSRFLPRFRAGLQAETAVRQQAAAQATTDNPASSTTGDDWAQQAAAADQRRYARIEAAAARAFQAAFDATDVSSKAVTTASSVSSPRSQTYQFVGVIQPRQRNRKTNNNDSTQPAATAPITWYARPKPADADWSVRLVHVNRRAILYDLFRRGKIDVMAKYHNTGQKILDADKRPTRQPVIQAEYIVRERNWK
jgi:hypothetical protein